MRRARPVDSPQGSFITVNTYPQSAPPTPRARIPLAKPFWTYALIGVTVCVYLLQMALGDAFTFAYGLKVNSLINSGEYWRLITPVFFHGSVMHILFNMYALYNVGPQVESAVGSARFLLYYFVTGFIGVLASFTFSPDYSLGASGAIFGLIAAFAVLLYRNREILGPVGRNVLANVVFIIILNVFLSFSGGIDLWGHFGGLAGGLILGWLIGPVWGRGEDPYGMTTEIADRQPLSRQWPLLAAFLAVLAFLTVWLVGRPAGL
jgi:rhomboid protease GluP